MKLTNYTCPPASKLVAELHCDIEQAKEARALMRGEIKITGNVKYPHTNAWIDRCYNKPKRIELIMSALDELLGSFGVDAITNDDGRYALASWLNTGDTYSTTLLFRHDSGTFRLTTYDDFIEANEKRLGLRSF